MKIKYVPELSYSGCFSNHHAKNLQLLNFYSLFHLLPVSPQKLLKSEFPLRKAVYSVS